MMHELTFFRQARHDGGIRMGVELDGETLLLSHSEPGPADREDDPLGPALLWFVDIRCQGEDLPRDAESARGWFLKNRDALIEGLEEFAQEIKAGTDDDSPVLFPKTLAPAGQGQKEDLVVNYVCSSIRRIKGPQLSHSMQEIADRFSEYLAQLRPLTPALR
ncbi:MAG: hypothetical protein U0790_21400 [Isosphaeraceae bacterium]